MTHKADPLLDAHCRLLAGDPTASATIFKLAYGPLIGLLRRTYPALPDDIAADLATDAVVEYLAAPNNFDSSKARLKTYLWRIANGDAINWLNKESTHARLHKKFVEVEGDGGNTDGDAETARLDAETILRKFGTEIVLDATDEAVLRLMLLGEDRTDQYAEAIGASDLSPGDQRLAVKKYRDKLEKRLERLGKRL